MSNTLVVDNDFINKLALVDQLELLRVEGNKIVITDLVYEELRKGAGKGSEAAIKAREWLNNNRNESWLKIDVPTKPLSPELAKTLGGGEGSIVSYINEQKILTPDANHTALTDNIKDAKKITEALDDPSRANVRMVREYTNDLAARNIITPDEYTRLEIEMVNSKVVEKGQEVYRQVFSTPRAEAYTIIPDTPNYGATEIEIVRRKGLNVNGKPDIALSDINKDLKARGYSPIDALDVANAHINTQYSLKEISAGRTPQITQAQLEQSRDLLHKAATELRDTPQVAKLNKQISATNAFINGDADLAKNIYTSPPAILQPESPNSFNQAFKRDQADLTAPVPTSSPRAMHQYISAVEQAEHRIATAHQLEKTATQQAQQTARAAEISALAQRHTNPYEPHTADLPPHKGIDVHKPKVGIDIDADDLKMVGKVGKIAKPLAVVVAGYSIYDEVNNAIDKETTTKDKVAAGISTSINATAKNVVEGVASTAGLVEGWVVGGIKNNNGLIGGVVGADIGSDVRGEQALNAFKSTRFEKTVTETTANTVHFWADQVSQAQATITQVYNGSALLQKSVKQVNTLLNETNQNLEKLGSQAKQVYENSNAKPYIDNATQYVYQKVGEASDFAKRNINDAVNYAGEQYNQAKAWGEGKWNEFSQTEIGQRVIGNSNNTVVEAKKDAYQYYEVRDPAELARRQQREASRYNYNQQPTELGSNNQDKKSTKAVQQLLNAAGYSVRVTGSYDSQTEQAVRRFQHKQHLPEDGTIGENDFKALAKTAQSHQHNLAVQRERNMQLQHKLGVLGFDVKVTGKMDKQTAHAIREFEHAFGLDVNGKLSRKEQSTLDRAFKETNTKNAQLALATLGYEVNVTGQIDEATKKAIAQYEKDHGLKKTGALDGQETVHLYKTVQKNLSLINEHGGLLALGTHHNNVGAVQQALQDLGYDVPVTNYFGKKTQAALKSFQQDNGMTADGVFKQADFERIDQLISLKEQNTLIKTETTEPTQQPNTQAITSPANQPNTTAQAVLPEQGKQADEQMIGVLSSSPAFTALAPNAHMNMTMAQAEPQSSVASLHNAPQQTEQPSAPQMAQTTADSIQLTPIVSKLHEQITLHLTQGQFGNQIAHLSDKEQQAAIALATYEATRNLARSVDYVFVNKDGKMCMSFDGDKGYSSSMNIAQSQVNDATQILTASLNLQQNQQQAATPRHELSNYQKAM